MIFDLKILIKDDGQYMEFFKKEKRKEDYVLLL